MFQERSLQPWSCFRSGRYTARKNDNISMLYMVYQGVLFGSSILGPATIFLLVVGSVDAVFQIGLGQAVLLGLIPLVAFLIVCYKCSNDTQVAHQTCSNDTPRQHKSRV